MKSSVCIEMIFTEYPFLERIEKAAEAGFDAVEFWNWDNKDLPAIKAAVDQAGLGIASFQSNLGGTLIHPDHRENFVAGIKKSLGKAQEMGVPSLFLLSDELGEDRSVRCSFDTPRVSGNLRFDNPFPRPHDSSLDSAPAQRSSSGSATRLTASMSACLSVPITHSTEP